MYRRPERSEIDRARLTCRHRTGLDITSDWPAYWSPYRDFAFTAGAKAVLAAGGAFCEDIAFTPARINGTDEIEIREV